MLNQLCSIVLLMGPLITEANSEEEKLVLGNKLKVVLRKIDKCECVIVMLMFKAGIRDDQKDKRGLSHLAEHLYCYSATKSFKEKEVWNYYIQNSGVKGANPYEVSNAETTHDFTYFYAVIRPDNLGTALKMEADRLNGIQISPELFKDEVGRAVSEMDNVRSRPLNKALAIFDSMYDKEFPNLISKCGEEDDLKTLKIEDVKDFINKFYKPANATLLVIGGFDFDEVKNTIKEYFSDIPSGEQQERAPVKTTINSGAIEKSFELEQANTNYLTITFPAGGDSLSETLSLLIINRLLFMQIQTDSNYPKDTYPIIEYSQFSKEDRGCLFIMWEIKNTKLLNETKSRVLKSIFKYSENPIPTDQLQQFKFMMSMEFKVQDPNFDNPAFAQIPFHLLIANYALQRAIFSYHYEDTSDELISELDKMTVESIQSTAKKYLTSKNVKTFIFTTGK
ncbi:MAG: insulinase family protein [Planctomycetes bacterium]|nr:insulinase family protein [Planctomycetota bacterium]